MAVEPLSPLLGRKKIIKLINEAVAGVMETSPTQLAENLFDVEAQAGDFFADGERMPDGNYLGRVSSVIGKQPGTITWKQHVRPGGTFMTLLTLAGYKSDGGSPPTYKPSSDLTTRQTWTIWVYEDGFLKKFYGCMAKIKIEGEDGKPLMATIEAEGIYSTTIDAAMPVQAPIATAPYIFRGVAATDATAVLPKMEKISFDLGALVEERMDIAAASGIAHYLVTEITPSVSLDPEARKVADQDAYGRMLAGATSALSVIITSTSHSLTLTAPAVQRIKVNSENRGKLLIHALDLQCCNSSGDDALSIQEN